ncbi:MAG: SBBP repeat-containing protein [Candidatus Hodarchaeota archaeon]
MKSKIYFILSVLILNFSLLNINQISIRDTPEVEKSTLNISNNNELYYIDWELTWGGPEQEYGRGGIAIDNNGSIYIAGSTYSYGSGGYDAFLFKYDENGKKVWNLTWGDSQHQMPHDIAISPSGNIYITGEYGSIGGIPTYVFLVKFDSNGSYQWDDKWGPSDWNEGYGVAVDEHENIYVTGRAGSDFVLLKYNSDGIQTWNKIDTNLQEGKDVAIGAPGTLYTIGRIGDQAYLSKYNDNGIMIWHRVWGGSSFEHVEAMAVDNLYNVYFTGATSSFGAGREDVYIIKYSSSGSLIWNITWGTPFYEYANGITLDENNNIYLTGETDMTTLISGCDTSASNMSGANNAFIAKFDPQGNNIWYDTWGNHDFTVGNRIGLDAEGCIYVTGTTYRSGGGEGDLFLVKYKPSPIKIPPLYIPGYELFTIAIIGVILIIGIVQKKYFCLKN